MFLRHHSGRMVSLLILAGLALSARAGIGAEPENAVLPEESQAQRDQRMAWWREARFGMFIHWGVYAVPAGTYNDKQIPGIGEWTAQYIALRALREPDAFPASDAGLLRGVALIDGMRSSPDSLLKRSESWRPWRAYAAQHLWAAQSVRIPTGGTHG